MRPSRAVLATSALLAAGCAQAPPRPDVVWPDPPNPPRVRYVKSLRTPADMQPKGWDAFRRAILGARDEVVLQRPMGLALSEDGQRLYIADPKLAMVVLADFQAHTMRQFAPDEPIRDPFGVALDADENLYVSDTRSKQVVVLSKEGKRLRAIARDAARPTGIAVDRRRRILYVTDSGSVKTDQHRILAYGLDGQFLRSIGARGLEDGQFNFPVFLALDAAGNLYVADTMNFRIQVFDPEGSLVRKFGEQGDVPGTFASMKGLAFDGFGNLYAVEHEAAVVQIFNRDFDLLMFFGGLARKLEFMEMPCGIAIDPQTNRIYVGDQGGFSRINVYELVNTRPEDSKPPREAQPEAGKK